MTPEQELDLQMAEPEDGSLIQMAVSFPGSPVTYTYAAVHVAGKWYLTGDGGVFRTWSSLVGWLKNKNAEVTSLSRATSWEDML